jgi:septal ring factor EnvC (AmiA/AmiB activator)
MFSRPRQPGIWRRRAAVPLLIGLVAWATYTEMPKALAQNSGTEISDPKAAAEALRRIETQLQTGKSTQAELDRITRELSEQVDRLRTQMRATAGDAQETEATMTRTEARLAELEADADAKRTRLGERSRELVALTGALQRLARRPASELLMLNRPPMDVARTGILLESALPRINAEAERLKADLARLSEVEADIRAQRDRLADAAASLATKRDRLSELAREKAQLLELTTARKQGTAERVASLAQSAKSLGDLLATLEQSAAQERAEQDRMATLVPPGNTPEDTPGGTPGRTSAATEDAPDRGEPDAKIAAEAEAEASAAARAASPGTLAVLPRAPAITGAKGQLIVPAAGRVTKRFGEADPEGLRDHGFVLETRPGALVVAPYDGRVLHAGRFAGLGRILIIEHGDGYHTLLGGLSRLEVGSEQRVLAGEPVGLMSTDASERTELYLELRHNGDPIDPYSWFSGLSGKAEG